MGEEPRGLRPVEDAIESPPETDFIDDVIEHSGKMPPELATSIIRRKFLDENGNKLTLKELSAGIEEDTGEKMPPERARQRLSAIEQTARKLAHERGKAPTKEILG